MKLSLLESKILGVVSLKADASIIEISKLVKARAHSCRYAIDSLVSKGLLNQRVIINSCRIGYSIYALWFSLSPKYRKDSKALFSYLENSKIIGYIGEQDGEYPFRVDLYCKTLQELSDFFTEVGAVFGNVFQTKTLAIVYSITDFSLKHLCPSEKELLACRVGVEPELVSINEVDHRILQILSRVSNKTHAAIARELNIPLATLEYRIKNLIKKKVIIGYHCWSQVEEVNSVGLKVSLHRLKFSALTAELVAQMQDFSRKNAYVFSLTHFLGDYDFELCLSTRSIHDQKSFRAALEEEFGGKILEHLEVAMVSHRKISNYPF